MKIRRPQSGSTRYGEIRRNDMECPFKLPLQTDEQDDYIPFYDGNGSFLFSIEKPLGDTEVAPLQAKYILEAVNNYKEGC